MSFKEKIEIAKQLDKLQVDAIEFAPLQDEKADTLLIKTVAALVRQSAVALPIALTQEPSPPPGRQSGTPRTPDWS